MIHHIDLGLDSCKNPHHDKAIDSSYALQGEAKLISLIYINNYEGNVKQGDEGT